jgi:hypothetical protein
VVRVKTSLILFVFLLAGTFSIAACQSAAPSPTIAVETPTPAEAAVSPTPLPTDTPTPQPEQVILVYDPASGFSAGEALQQALERLAGEAGLDFVTVPSLTAAEITPGTRLVVLTPPGNGAADLISSAPQTQFLVVGVPGLQAAENVSIIGPEGEQHDLQGFLAGYIAAVVTQDWRVAALGVSDSAPGLASSNAFLKGAEYFCGLCNPPFPPFVYPLSANLPAGSAPADWQAAAAELINQTNGVRTIYLAPGAGDETLLQYLTDQNIYMLGNLAPPETLQTRWVATVGVDPVTPLEALWPQLIAGEGGFVENLPVRYTAANPAVFTPGRQLLVDRLLVELDAGRIDSGVDPITGQIR